MLTVEEVLELEPGDEQYATWVNPGFQAVVREIKRTQTKRGQTMNICTLGSETGAAEISMTVFSAVKFNEGDLIEISGQGLRRTVYNGLQQVSMGKATEIHILGKSAHAPEQAARKAAGESPVGGSGTFPINGQNVGMAMKEALALTLAAHDGKPIKASLADPLFWSDVKTYASNIIRISRSLESGKLSPPSWPLPKKDEPAAAPEPPTTGRDSTPPAAAKPQPGPEGSAFMEGEGEDLNVPF